MGLPTSQPRLSAMSATGTSRPKLGTVAIQTHGCKLNQADSESIAQRFVEAGFTVVDAADSPDVYVVNTCTVTHTADAKARQALKSARRRNPGALVVATGCYAHRAPQELASLDSTQLVVSNPDKGLLIEKVLGIYSQGAQPLPFAQEASLVTSSRSGRTPTSTHRTRSMVKIQEGCDQVCAYCIVPKVRGRERSIPPQEIIDRINTASDRGCREVVLTGTQLGTYGFDLPGLSPSRLLRTVLEQTLVPRIRVSSLQPQEISTEMLDLWSDTRLCPHFHMPLQSGCDATLRRMRRRYTGADYAAAVAKVRSAVKDVAITADIIAGFPGETDQEFETSFSFAESMEFADMHVFPYSSRPGTSAAHFGGKVSPAVTKERVGQLIALSQRQSTSYRSGLLGTTRAVLWESQVKTSDGPVHRGLTDNYVRVHAAGDRDLANSITDATLLTLQDDSILAEV